MISKYDEVLDLMLEIIYLNFQKELGIGIDINQKIEDEQNKLTMLLEENNINSETWHMNEWHKVLDNRENKINEQIGDK